MASSLFVVILSLVVALPAFGVALADDEILRRKRGLVSELQNCRSIETERERLQCYDDVAKRNVPPTFEGKLGFKTKPFHIDRAHLLRFRSQGVIFVLYLFDEQGNVLQNLHVGGGGEDSYLIESAGTYSLQIDGSARWQIWLEPAFGKDLD